MRTRAFRTAVLATALTVGLAGCGADAGDSGDEIRIGVTLELSGASGVLGVPQANALRMVEKQVNREGVLGKRVKLIIRDNKSNPALAARQVEDFIEGEKVTGILGASTEAATLPFTDVVESKRTPTISTASADTIIAPNEKRRYVFKTPPSGLAVIEVVLADFVDKGIRTVGVLAPDNNYGAAATMFFTAAAAQRGITVIRAETYRRAADDHAAEVGRLVATNPQAILVGGVMPSVGVLARNIREAGYAGDTYFDGAAEGELFAPVTFRDSDGMRMVAPSMVAADRITANTPSLFAQKEFFTRYTREYGDFSPYAAYAADALQLMVEAIKKAGSTDHAAVRDALESLSYDGLSGSYAFSRKNHGGASADGLTVLTARSGTWTLAQ